MDSVIASSLPVFTLQREDETERETVLNTHSDKEKLLAKSRVNQLSLFHFFVVVTELVREPLMVFDAPLCLLTFGATHTKVKLQYNADIPV